MVLLALNFALPLNASGLFISRYFMVVAAPVPVAIEISSIGIFLPFAIHLYSVLLCETGRLNANGVVIFKVSVS